MARLVAAEVRRLRLPLHTPYRLSYRTFDEFEPYLVIVHDDGGRCGFADGHISPGSSSETREGGWAFMTEHLKRIVGMEIGDAKGQVLKSVDDSKVAATAIVSAMEMLLGCDLLEVSDDIALPLLAPTSAMTPEAIVNEVESRLVEGYRCLKIKVGKDVEGDLARVKCYQEAFSGQGTLRLDANRAFSRADGVRFARSLDPRGIELFEQPCAADDWDANAAVAAQSTVPLMLDEPICTTEDIERAATIDGVGFCKLKLKRAGSLERLAESLALVRVLGMEPVLGDGLGSDIHAWLEACVARFHIRNAGEFNGYLKCNDHLLVNPPRFDNGQMFLAGGVAPALDMAVVDRVTTERLLFA
ncbi:MAG: L-alanine-DL-glutamate epimerase-like enolase superfamily enzyme [Hyphomicrobiaceae bacterium]|jgi:L-alanine-DL-glutamate epimerase-like enolase superfamily enzyme